MWDTSTQLGGAEAADTEAEPASQVPEQARTLECDASQGGCEEFSEKGLELMMDELAALLEEYGDTDGANDVQTREDTTKDGRRRPKLQPLRIGNFVPRITATNREGQALSEDRADASAWPTFVVQTPTALTVEAERSAQDTSAAQKLDSSMLPTTTDESSEYQSSLTSPTLCDGEAGTGRSSVSLSTTIADVPDREDEISSKGHLEEPPRPRD